MKKIITYSSDASLLQQKSIDIASVEEANEIINVIKPMMKQDHVCGIAAIQVGIPKRLSVIKYNDGFFYLINPTITEQDEEILYHNEGCLSFPGKFITTKRYKHLTITNQRIEGDHFEDETLYFFHPEKHDQAYGGHNINDRMCIAVQHEIDHFNGVLYTSREVKLEPIKKDLSVGRNDPCPCGSGRKYKKCCLYKDG